jgi:hypothetical protein
MLSLSGSGKTHVRLKRYCRKEQRSTLKSECSTANTVAVTRRCFYLMTNSQFVLLQLWKGRKERKKPLGHGNGYIGDQAIWSNLLPTFLCRRTLSRTGKTKLNFCARCEHRIVRVTLLFVYSIKNILSTGQGGGDPRLPFL